jgi:hypothetical protein
LAHTTETGIVYVGTGSCEGIPVLPGEVSRVYLPSAMRQAP